MLEEERKEGKGRLLLPFFLTTTTNSKMIEIACSYSWMAGFYLYHSVCLYVVPQRSAQPPSLMAGAWKGEGFRPKGC
jgi:hypothetical protein